MGLSSIGERIRDCRKKRGMTQAALAGNFITRNMLSRIENGDALPSLPTLLYLAEKLEISPAFFLEEKETFFSSALAEILPTMRKSFEEGRFDRVVSVFLNSGAEADNEAAALLMYAYLEQARREFRSGSFSLFPKSAKAVHAYAEKTIFPTQNVLAELSLMEAVADNLQAPRISLDCEQYLRLSEEALSSDLYHYIVEDTAFNYISDKCRRHMEARGRMTRRDYRNAITILLALEEERADEDFSAFMLYRLYADLELCYKELRNFERAYHYSSRRSALFTAFQS